MNLHLTLVRLTTATLWRRRSRAPAVIITIAHLVPGTLLNPTTQTEPLHTILESLPRTWRLRKKEGDK